MKLSQEEKELIEKFRAGKSKKVVQEDKPYREAFLKHDLYTHRGISGEYAGELTVYYDSDGRGFTQFTKAKMQCIRETFEAGFELIINKGASFVSYIDGGEELWYDDVGYGIEGVDNSWANDHLEKFKVLRKVKK